MGASESTPDEPSVEPPPVVELDNELKEWAWRQYSLTASDSMTKKDLGFKVIWDSVHFETRDVCYGDKQGPSPSQSTMVFKSDYTNNTMETQEHNFTTQRTTEATSTTALTNGFTRGVKNGITIPVPPEVTNVTSGFGNEVDVETESKNSVKHSMTWSANSPIRVPRSSRTVATLQINQETFNCSFTAVVVFRGRVKIKISNRKTWAFLMTVENLIGRIVKDVFEEYGYTYNGSDPLSVHTDGRRCFGQSGALSVLSMACHRRWKSPTLAVTENNLQRIGSETVHTCQRPWTYCFWAYFYQKPHF